jgi:hypothetical protein
MKEVQPRFEKHGNLKTKERAVFLTCELVISGMGVTVTS